MLVPRWLGGSKEGGGSADTPASTRQGHPALIVARAGGCRQPTGVSSAGLGSDSGVLSSQINLLSPRGPAQIW